MVSCVMHIIDTVLYILFASTISIHVHVVYIIQVSQRTVITTYIDSCLRWVNGYTHSCRNKAEVGNKMLHIFYQSIIDNGDVDPEL